MLTGGEQAGDYRVVAAIAHGGMSTVYRVVDTRDESIWALKVLTLDQPGMPERFRGEAAIQASVEHPNIVAAREVVELGDQLGIVMELVDGPSLDLWLQRNPDATFDTRHVLARQIVEAVAAAHRAGMVHRDLKPANVLIAAPPPAPEAIPAWLVPTGPRPDPPPEPTDHPGIAKVTDFGLAKQEGRPALTRTGIALGTPRYMAPEQFRDAKRVDHRADVFALGALLYELYSGRPAFDRDSLVDAYEALAYGDYVDPAVFGVPEGACAAIRGALQVDPDQRIPDCDTFLAVMDGGSWSPADPTPAPPPVPPPPPPRLRRTWLLVAGVGVGMLMLAALGGIGIVTAVVASEAWLGDDVEQPPRQRRPGRGKRR